MSFGIKDKPRIRKLINSPRALDEFMETGHRMFPDWRWTRADVLNEFLKIDRELTVLEDEAVYLGRS